MVRKGKAEGVLAALSAVAVVATMGVCGTSWAVSAEATSEVASVESPASLGPKVSDVTSAVMSQSRRLDGQLTSAAGTSADLAGREEALEGSVAETAEAISRRQEAEARAREDAAEAARAQAEAQARADAEAARQASEDAGRDGPDGGSAGAASGSHIQATTEEAGTAGRTLAKTGQRRSPAEAVAWLAVNVAATASPDAALTSPGNAWYRLDDARLANEYRVCDATLGAWHGNSAVASCTQTVAMVVGATVDPDAACMPASGGPASLMDYLTSRPDLFQEVTGQAPQPGDIMANAGHDCIWVGNELARQRFPGTDGTVVESHYGQGRIGCARYPAVSAYGGTDGFRVFRPVAYHTNASHALVDYESLVS